MLSGLWIVIIAVPAVVALVGGAFAVAYTRKQKELHSIEHARQTFQIRREWLEADFVSRAGSSGKPRGLRWMNCDFDDGVAFARDRRTGQYRALVGVTISFEAIEGGGMEEVEAVSNLRAATVVFRLDGPEWQADGRALFNLNPEEAIDNADSVWYVDWAPTFTKVRTTLTSSCSRMPVHGPMDGHSSARGARAPSNGTY